jgi:peptide-methionine (S)-S-oxide reductase
MQLRAIIDKTSPSRRRLSPCGCGNRLFTRPIKETPVTRPSLYATVVCLTLAPLAACTPDSNSPRTENQPVNEAERELAAAPQPTNGDDLETVTFGAGCYWCVEAVFQQLEGVESVVSGFSGGATENPTYEEVCSGTTGHAEVCQIRFLPDVISFEQLLEVFWKTHDPTTLNRQGADVGTQYRSVVFYHNEEQKALAEEYKKKLDESGAFANPIVTEITPYTSFFKAKDDHQNYFRENPTQRYCQLVIAPKVEKFEKVFADKLKK